MATSRYPVLREETHAETIVLGSRFWANAVRISSDAEAQSFVQRLREVHPDATHHCYAFVVGPPASTRCVGCSDDGEPHNSAGRPILDVLLHSGIGDLACVVTRWFGGTKLGRGGLVRAYGEAAQRALAEAQLEDKVLWWKGEIRLDYGQVDQILRELASFSVEVEERTFGAQVTLRLRVDVELRGQVQAKITDLTRGRAVLSPIEDAST